MLVLVRLGFYFSYGELSYDELFFIFYVEKWDSATFIRRVTTLQNLSNAKLSNAVGMENLYENKLVSCFFVTLGNA